MNLKGLLLFVLAAAVFIAAPGIGICGDTGTIKGKVNFQGKPLGGAFVFLYSDYDSGFTGKPDYQAGPTADDGVFEVQAAPGSYFLIARKPVDGTLEAPAPGDYYAFYGGNPVVAEADEQINIGINCSPILPVDKLHIEGGTGIRGKVFADGKPVDRARVTLYQDGDTIFRGIGYASVLTSPGGDFAFSLAPGKYYVVARKRMGDDRMGPLSEGDLFAFEDKNPVEVVDGSYTVIAMNAVNKLVKVKEKGQAVTLGGTVKAGETTISGTVKDKDGKPVAGVYVSAFRDSMMIYKPDFISGITGEDGKYTITLSEGGEYFIAGRNTIGGPAEKGDLLGRYAGNEDHSVVIKDGEKVKGIDIVVETVQ